MCSDEKLPEGQVYLHQTNKLVDMGGSVQKRFLIQVWISRVENRKGKENCHLGI